MSQHNTTEPGDWIGALSAAVGAWLGEQTTYAERLRAGRSVDDRPLRAILEEAAALALQPPAAATAEQIAAAAINKAREWPFVVATINDLVPTAHNTLRAMLNRAATVSTARARKD